MKTFKHTLITILASAFAFCIVAARATSIYAAELPVIPVEEAELSAEPDIIVVEEAVLANNDILAPAGFEEDETSIEEIEFYEPDQQPDNYPGYIGRLYVPDVGIDVALYYANSQSITDRADCAVASDFWGRGNLVVADHSNQNFSTLTEVTTGMWGKIVYADGSFNDLLCVESCSAYNTEYDIVNANGDSMTNRFDYLLYTCLGNWQNHACGWYVY